MYSKYYVFHSCLGYLYRLVLTNKPGSGCALLLLEIFFGLIGYSAFHETLILSFDEKTTQLWSGAITLSLLILYNLFRILRRYKKQIQADDLNSPSNSSENIG